MSSLNNIDSSQIEQITIISSFFSLFLASLFGWLIARSYKYSSHSISGGRQVENSLLPLALIVCVIISVVKSSLALSLGLVGALSIVRFRTPIKDPEDLIYLFLSIVTGIGFGANQDFFTSISLTIILLILNTRFYLNYKKTQRKDSLFEFYLNIQWEKNDDITLPEIINALSPTCRKLSLVRYEKINSRINLLIQISINESSNIDTIIKDLNNFNNELNIQINNSALDY